MNDMKKLLTFIVLCVCCSTLVAQPSRKEGRRERKAPQEQVEITPTVVKLYENGAPDSNGITQPEKDHGWGVVNVTEPTLAIYVAKGERATGQAVVVCPGGAYQFEAMNNEGHPVAKWLVRRGITAVVLKYRLPNAHPDIPINDALAAIEYVRTHAVELGVNPAEIGIIGFSAGGHLAASASTRFTSEANRPDFSILVYPVITMTMLTHGGSRDALLGKGASEELIKEYACENNVSASTPPTFIVHCNDDGVVPVENTFMYVEALRRNKVPYTLQIYPDGGHGWGFLEGPGRLDKWRRSFYMSLGHWLKTIDKE
ncbi:MAG: alpha/beta hydrolase [Rikenellaceae bacterium]|nr:alpha/beta hydrolase [Rikenellaceae bacterium]